MVCPIIKKKFTKPALSVDAQLLLLTGRGLLVPNPDLATFYLNTIGYYRLSGYTKHFLQSDEHGNKINSFNEGVIFEDVLDLYIFDRKLRLHLIDAIERIEVSVRASLSNSVAINHGPHWYQNTNLFKNNYDHPSLIVEIKRQIAHRADTPERRQKRDIFIHHYYDTYNDPDMPPSWMVFEAASFRLISRLFEGLHKTETTQICVPLRITHEILTSWLHSISYVRNLCAHHSRVWNKTLTIKPKISNKYKTIFNGNHTIYSVMVIIQILLDDVAPDNSWAERLRDLICSHPKVDIKRMGFPDDWDNQEFWSLEPCKAPA